MSKQPEIKDWGKLYQLIIELKKLAPWQWMVEEEMFAVEHPDTGEIGFASVMGATEQFYALSFYMGINAYHQFWGLQFTEPGPFTYQKILEIPQLQVSFEDSVDVSSRDKKLYKQLGLTFRGKNAWPLAKSFKPGFVPWYLDASEVKFLQIVVEQALDVCARAENDSSILNFEDNDKDICLLRKQVQQGNEKVWIDTEFEVPDPVPADYNIRVDSLVFEKLLEMPISDLIVEMDVFLLPRPIDDNKEQPYYPYMLAIVDEKTGMIIAHELLSPLPDLNSMYCNLPLNVCKTLGDLQKPCKVKMKTPLLVSLLEPLFNDLNIKIEHVDDLPFIDDFRMAALNM